MLYYRVNSHFLTLIVEKDKDSPKVKQTLLHQLLSHILLIFHPLERNFLHIYIWWLEPKISVHYYHSLWKFKQL